MCSIGNSVKPLAQPVRLDFSRTEKEPDLATFISRLATTKEKASTYGNALIWFESYDSDKGDVRFQNINSSKKLPDFSVRIENNKPTEFHQSNRDYNTLGAKDFYGIPKELEDYILQWIQPSQEAPSMALGSELHALSLGAEVAHGSPKVDAPKETQTQKDGLPPLTPGQQVVLWGLEKSIQLNGRSGVVVDAEKDGRIPVRIDGYKDAVRVRRIKLIPYEKKDSLQEPKYNKRDYNRINSDRDNFLTPEIKNQINLHLKQTLKDGIITYNVSGALDPFLDYVENVFNTHPCVQTARYQSVKLKEPVLPFSIKDLAEAVTNTQLSNGDVVLTNIFTAVTDFKSIAFDAARIAGTDGDVFVVQDSNFCRHFLIDEQKKLNHASPHNPFHVVLPYVKAGGDPFVIFVRKSVTNDKKRISKLRIMLENKFDKSICNQFFKALFLNPTFDGYNGLYDHPMMFDVISVIVTVLELKDDEVHTININKFKCLEISDAFKAYGFLEKDCWRFSAPDSQYKVDVIRFSRK